MSLGRNGWLAVSVMMGVGLANPALAADVPAALPDVTVTSAREG